MLFFFFKVAYNYIKGRSLSSTRTSGRFLEVKDFIFDTNYIMKNVD